MIGIELDVIVRTLADTARTKQLFRALDSIQSQNGIHTRPIVVVNGQSCNPMTVKLLEQRSGILLHFMQQASAGRALAAGYRLATAEFLAFLDDDDALIEGALLKPLTWMADNPQCDVVVTNGYRVHPDGKLVKSSHIEDHVSNPMLSLLDENWLSPGASIFRTQSVESECLNIDLDHQEWTQMAFEFCAKHKRIHFIDVATVLFYDTPGSMSKKFSHRKRELDILQRIRFDRRIDVEARRKASRKYFNLLHILAMEYWKQGKYGQAWQYHLASMRPPHTFRYLLSSRKLLWPFKTL